MTAIFLTMILMALMFGFGASIVDQGGVRNRTSARGSRVMICRYREDMNR